ncbi:helix-turn-helix domain-containing protein [Patescibacteria group bacterium]|nr:helix-turn-helix domain-containing protein [Patescibacteria group bacterium]MBU4367644.1 helix-turn-helix domain-containing protein [Patescibacteria group bacterium]MBU4462124.1 helix-turn-helix domain-containing protein [Patescibacteria group bacterium]MCG2700443.1 helix-turn-helix domain-containing protein [Candidatus Parcubacteria bacterium]
MEFITRKEASEIFNVSERTLDRWIEKGVLKAHKFGKSRNSSVRIEKSEIKKFLEKNKKING